MHISPCSLSSAPSHFSETSDFIRLAKENRHVIIRAPQYAEKDFILLNLYSAIIGISGMITEKEFNFLFKANGKLSRKDQIHRLVVLQPIKENTICGAIHYEIQKTVEKVNELIIHSLSILSSHRRNNFGSLLLSLALFEAQKAACTKVSLRTTKQGAFLYAAFGFQPISNTQIPPGAWDKLPYLVKVKIIHQFKEEVSSYLTLDLTDQKIRSLIQARLGKALEHSQATNLTNEIDLEKIDIPAVVDNWNIFPKKESDDEDASDLISYFLQ